MGDTSAQPRPGQLMNSVFRGTTSLAGIRDACCTSSPCFVPVGCPRQVPPSMGGLPRFRTAGRKSGIADALPISNGLFGCPAADGLPWYALCGLRVCIPRSGVDQGNETLETLNHNQGWLRWPNNFSAECSMIEPRLDLSARPA